MTSPPSSAPYSPFASSQGLIGGALCAIDGVKLPSQASKHRSGTRANFERQATKLEALAKQLLSKHETLDGEPIETDLSEQRDRKINRLNHDAAQLREWLAANPNDRLGASGETHQEQSHRQ